MNWLFTCASCGKKQKACWEETKKFDLANKIEIRGELIWAWNVRHLEYLVSVLSGNEIKSHKWVFFRTYMHKKWFTKTKNISDINKIKALVAKNQTI